MLIPPSALGVLLGAMAKVSIAELLLGGILPGLVLAVMYIAYFAVRATVQPELAPRYVAPPVPLGARLGGLLEVAPLLLLVLVVTGFIFLGIATPSESAAMGVVATLVLAAGYRRLSWAAIGSSLMAAMTTTSMMLLVIVGSSGFSQLLAATGATSALVAAVAELDLSPLVTVIIMQLIVLLLGCFIDTISIMLVAIPVFMPVVLAIGVDPIWFCILILDAARACRDDVHAAVRGAAVRDEGGWGKEGLYLACLERVYTEIRTSERALNLLDCSPVEGITKLVEFTFDHMLNHQDFVRIVVVENMQRSRFLKKLAPLPSAASDLVTTIREILDRGHREGQFRAGVDAVQLYVSILSLSYLHLSNRYTLSFTYETDLGAREWIARRRIHVTEMVLSYLSARGDG